ncbi:MAG TPA: diaminopimelate epimerase [Clostridiales bacterium]|nr:diaminopimelate epimerase [Clostridiales bacterium]
MKFTKMHGAGNDYIYINCFEEKVNDPSKIAKFVSDRHFGIGSDGLVLIMPSSKADFRMRMFNSDGSEAEMCGNAIRCVGKYVYDHGLTDQKQLSIETLAGIKYLVLQTKDNKVDSVRVDMGEPILTPTDIPVKSNKELFVNQPVQVLDRTFHVTCVSMGNPHAISYVENTDSFDLYKYGPAMETHRLYPRKINAEFVQVISPTVLKMRVWERGAGETLACGTGACAVLVASVLNKFSERKSDVILLGGTLTIEWDETTNRVFMTGPATEVYHGEIDISKI